MEELRNFLIKYFGTHYSTASDYYRKVRLKDDFYSRITNSAVSKAKPFFRGICSEPEFKFIDGGSIGLQTNLLEKSDIDIYAMHPEQETYLYKIKRDLPRFLQSSGFEKVQMLPLRGHADNKRLIIKSEFEGCEVDFKVKLQYKYAKQFEQDYSALCCLDDDLKILFTWAKKEAKSIEEYKQLKTIYYRSCWSVYLEF